MLNSACVPRIARTRANTHRDIQTHIHPRLHPHPQPYPPLLDRHTYAYTNTRSRTRSPTLSPRPREGGPPENLRSQIWLKKGRWRTNVLQQRWAMKEVVSETGGRWGAKDEGYGARCQQLLGSAKLRRVAQKDPRFLVVRRRSPRMVALVRPPPTPILPCLSPRPPPPIAPPRPCYLRT